MISIRKFAGLLDQSMRDYEVQDEIDQKDLLPTAVLLADKLVGTLPAQRRRPMPALYASGMRRDMDRMRVSRELRHVRFDHNYGECMVDIYVCKGERDPFKPILTVECEGYSGGGRNVTPDASSETCDYLWDLFKLLQVPSPVRVFLARTTGHKVRPLERLVSRLVRAYGRYRRDRDVVFSTVLPATVLYDKHINVYRWQGRRKSSLVLRV